MEKNFNISEILMRAIWENTTDIQPFNLHTLTYHVSSIAYNFCFMYQRQLAAHYPLMKSPFTIKTSELGTVAHAYNTSCLEGGRWWITNSRPASEAFILRALSQYKK